MNYLDVLILIPLLWGMFHGFRKGLIREVVSILALIAGVFAAIHFSGWVADLLKPSIDERYTGVVAFALTFIGAVVLMYFAGKAIEKVAEAAALGLFNKIGGMIFGAAKYVFILSSLFSLISMIDSREIIIKSEHKNASLLYKPVAAVAPALIPKISTTLKELNSNENDTLKPKQQENVLE